MHCLICGEAHVSCKGTVGEPKGMVTIIRPEPPGANDWVADRYVFLDKYGNVVGEKDPNKLTQLVAPGCTLPRAEAERYGLLAPATAEVVPSPEPEPEPLPVLNDEAVSAPPEGAAEMTDAEEVVRPNRTKRKRN